MITCQDIIAQCNEFYMSNQQPEKWPYPEIMYQAYGIVLECLQKLQGGYFSEEYVIEKMEAILQMMLHIKVNRNDVK